MATYGIDLGTTYSCIAYVDDAGRPVVLRNGLEEDTTPSVVFFESATGVVVGRQAKDTAMLEPGLVVSLIKRQMGKEVELEFYEQTHTPESISALILRDLARSARAQTGEPVQDVVISVPAYFGLAEREATRRAGEIAGLNVLNLVAEPVAAALHYDSLAGSAGGERTILVYDLGGGTFDTTVIRLRGDEVQVVCTDGSYALGGADWDRRLVDHLLDELQEARPDADPGSDEQFLQTLASDAERLKKDLSNVESRKYAIRHSGPPVQVEITRTRFESLTSDLLDQTMEITRRTVEAAKARGVERFDEVLLVGGASNMPAVERGLRERFGFAPRLHDPHLAVAKGAALFALIESLHVSDERGGSAAATGAAAGNGAPSKAAIDEVVARTGLSPERVEELARKRVATAVPRAFGTRLLDAGSDDGRYYIDHLLHANDPLPSEVGPKRYATVADNQTAIRIEIYEQAGSRESEELEHNTRIGGSVITDLPPLPKGSPVEVTFHMDEMGRLRVHARELSTGKEMHIELAIGGMDDRAVAAARDAVSGYSVSE
jgi:molecular chaperone DnaK (HSP70)